jgi:undecaprenyl-phosphate 4-deoxy-4-formamido-L-arabinose transferase
MSHRAMNTPEVSIVIPVYNEEAGLQSLFDRLYPALDKLNRSYEVIFINDGSKDRSPAMLREQFQKRPEVTRVVLFNGNFGQHKAILAGFAYSRGQRIITLDADLQNPPEDIANLLAKMDEGYDYVGSIRRQRNDSAWRHLASRAMNHLRERITRIKMTDQGCMMRAYDRRIIDAINQCSEMNTFIPALAYTFAQRPTEIIVGHEERTAGESKYSLYSLIRLNFDLMTGFSAGAAADVLHARHAGCAGLRHAGAVSGRATDFPWPGRRWAVYAVCCCLLPDRYRPVRHWPAG